MKLYATSATGQDCEGKTSSPITAENFKIITRVLRSKYNVHACGASVRCSFRSSSTRVVFPSLGMSARSQSDEEIQATNPIYSLVARLFLLPPPEVCRKKG